MWDQFGIVNPKRRLSTPLGRDEWFPFYAGFSGEFARELFRTSGLPQGSLCMDPWNGSGTTSAAASLHKHRVLGFDLNPVMAVVARARLLPQGELPSVAPLLSDLARKSVDSSCEFDRTDPLLTWFVVDAATSIRSIERAIHKLLVSADSQTVALDRVSGFSAIAAFFYVALFRAVRRLLLRFTTSNPTWLRRPKTQQARLRPAFENVLASFQHCVIDMRNSILCEPSHWEMMDANCVIEVAPSDRLPVGDSTVDLVLTSPPYCTRIDYAISTSPELAVLGLGLDKGLRSLRSQLIGTPTIHAKAPLADSAWGDICSAFLEKVRSHSSKAAKSYYYKTYVQYFYGIDSSLRDIARCMKPRAKCIIVVQDSYFKDLKANLPAIFIDLCAKHGLRLGRRDDFPMTRTLVNINTNSRRYRTESSAVESVLCFNKS
jgi:hypothetical protein